MKMKFKTIALYTLGLSAVTYAILGFYVSTTGIEMSVHGHFAMILAIFFSYLIGVTLMALMFFSNRTGYDQQVQDSTIDANKPK
ncbi:MAG: hypothetical protein JKY60_14830 [Kordiimonadaceae bacterium]|nr:hypothetical protein [Kordiimonadaceae bacterium]